MIEHIETTRCVPFTRLSETINLSEGVCQVPTTKLHATTFSGAEYIQKVEADQGSLRTIVTQKNDKTQTSLNFLEKEEDTIGRRILLSISYFGGKAIFKDLGQKTKFRILFNTSNNFVLIATPVA